MDHIIDRRWPVPMGGKYPANYTPLQVTFEAEVKAYYEAPDRALVAHCGDTVCGWRI